MRDHIIAAYLGSILNPLERVGRVTSTIIEEELLDASGFVLVLHVGFTAEQTDRSKLITHDEGLAITAELAI